MNQRLFLQSLTKMNQRLFSPELDKNIDQEKVQPSKRSHPINYMKNATSMFDYFFLIGNTTTGEQDNNPRILISFPSTIESSIPIDNILSFSFPTGPERHKLSGINHDSISDFFVFTIFINEIPYFGFCLHAFPINDLFLTPSHCAVCFCLLTKVPIYSSHFVFLSYLALLCADRSKVPTDLNPSIPEINNSGTVPSGFNEEGKIAFDPSITLPNFFPTLLYTYYGHGPGSPKVTLYGSYPLYFPPCQNKKCILYSCLDILFNIFSVEQILSILSALLLDFQVVIVGSNLGLVTSCILSLDLLTKPFNFSGSIIPILPVKQNFLELLNSPIPYLIGSPPSKDLFNIDYSETSFFVSIDKKFIPLNKSIPQFPNYQSVLREIKKNYIRFRAEK